MRIAVVGAGAVGGYFGARLAAAGEQVVFVARGAGLAALREHGLQVDSPLGDIELRTVEATDDPRQVGPVDLVLVCVKAWQVGDAEPAIRPLVGPQTAILPLQNGVEAAEQLARTHGADRVLGGTCRIISVVEAPGRIRHVGVDPHIALGELDNRPSERARRIVETLRGADIGAEVVDDVQAAIWRKFVLICSVSGLGAVTRSPIGVVRSVPQTRAMLEQAMREIVAVARGRGVALATGTIDRALAFVDSLPAEGTTSMQRDLLAGRPSELDSQNGTVVRLGEAAGIDTPLNRFIYHSLLPLEASARAPRGGGG